MTREDALKLFRPIFRKLDNDVDLQLFGFWLFDKLPDYWFTHPSSSTGKYHPKFANENGGLALHTFCACQYWMQLYRGFEQDLNSTDFAIGLFATIFHDALKYGDNLPHTTKTHCKDAADWVWEQWVIYGTEKPDGIVQNVMVKICECIRHHMGPWSFCGKPVTLLQQLVFIADYMASSQIMEMEVFTEK